MGAKLWCVPGSLSCASTAATSISAVSSGEAVGSGRGLGAAWAGAVGSSSGAASMRRAPARAWLCRSLSAGSGDDGGRKHSVLFGEIEVFIQDVDGSGMRGVGVFVQDIEGGGVHGGAVGIVGWSSLSARSKRSCVTCERGRENTGPRVPRVRRRRRSGVGRRSCGGSRCLGHSCGNCSPRRSSTVHLHDHIANLDFVALAQRGGLHELCGR